MMFDRMLGPPAPFAPRFGQGTTRRLGSRLTARPPTTASRLAQVLVEKLVEGPGLQSPRRGDAAGRDAGGAVIVSDRSVGEPGPVSQENDVSNLTVWKFEDVNAAEEVLVTLTDLQKQGLIQIQDGAVVRWDEHRKQPKTVQLHNLTGIGAMSGAFWGMLLGLLFFVPLLGAGMGAALGAMSGSLSDVGIDGTFIKEIREKVTPGTSALFLLSAAGVRDRLAEAFEGTEVELLHTNFSADEEAKLREVFEA